MTFSSILGALVLTLVASSNTEQNQPKEVIEIPRSHERLSSDAPPHHPILIDTTIIMMAIVEDLTGEQEEREGFILAPAYRGWVSTLGKAQQGHGVFMACRARGPP